MSEESLRELLDQSIYPPGEGISNVNYSAMRKLLECIVQRLGTDRDTADGGRKSSVDRDVEESLLDEKGSEDFEQQSTVPGELPSDAERLSISDPTGEEGVSKIDLMQDLLEKNQVLEERTNNQKDELEMLQNQLSQSTSLMQDLLNKNQELEEETNKLRKQMETLQNQLNQSISLMQDLSQENQELKDETNDLKKNVDTLQNRSHMQGFSNENQELKEETVNLRKEMETLKKQFSQVCEMKAVDPKSSGLGGELDKSEMSASECIDGICDSEQQHNLNNVPRNPVQQLYTEVQYIRQELQALRMEQRRTSEKEMQDKFTDLTNDVQRAILQLHAEFEKLHGTTQLIKDDMQEQTHIENLQEAITELEVKVDKKVDMHALETTVSATTEQLNGMFKDLLKNTTVFEENYHTVTEKIFRELKLSHAEMDRLRKQVEMLHKAQSSESDNAAIVKKRLTTRFHCLSCDRPVNMKTPGPRVEVLPVLPGFPLRHHRRTTPSTNLGQSTRSSTERSMKQTRKGESCGSDGLINIGYCEYHVNHSQLSESISKNFKQGSPLGQQHSETDLICIGTSCCRKEKQWIPEDSMPQTLQSQQQVSSVPSAKE